MSRNPIRHRIEYTQNKHSRAVIRDDIIVIRLARNLSRNEEKEHIEYLLKRMTVQLKEHQKKITIDPFRSLLQGGSKLTVQIATGKKYLFELIPGRRLRAHRTLKGWLIEIGPKTRRKALHRYLWELLSEAEADRMVKLVDEINDATYDEHFKLLRFKFACTQWGSCSPKDVIMLNTALLFVPPSVLRYVAVHELAHLIHPDHSEAFWNKVEEGMPTYKRARKMLQGYRLPSL